MIVFYLYQNKLIFQQLLAPRRSSQVIEFFSVKVFVYPVQTTWCWENCFFKISLQSRGYSIKKHGGKISLQTWENKQPKLKCPTEYHKPNPMSFISWPIRKEARNQINQSELKSDTGAVKSERASQYPTFNYQSQCAAAIPLYMCFYVNATSGNLSSSLSARVRKYIRK